MSTSQTPFEQRELTLNEIGRILWKGRWLVIWVTLACTLAAGTTAWLMPKSYQAMAVISPVSENASNQLSGMSSLTSQFAGLASLAGISVASDSKKAESLAVLQSEALTEKYITDNNLLPLLYRDKWDQVAGKWKVTDPKKMPTLWKANELFKKKIRVVSTNTKTGMVQLVINWNDPVIAAKWANDLVKDTNDFLRNKAITQSERNIAYLTEEASKTDAVGVKQAIYTILQNEINKVMLARGSDEFAFKLIDPAVPPEKPSSPQVVLWIVGGFILGFALSATILSMRKRVV